MIPVWLPHKIDSINIKPGEYEFVENSVKLLGIRFDFKRINIVTNDFIIEIANCSDNIHKFIFLNDC